MFFVFSLLFVSFSSSKAIESKRGALIVVNLEKEKSDYTDLIAREQNFDFKIDIVSLQEKKIKQKPENIRNFLWEQKNKYCFFVLDEEIPYGVINEGTVLTDYFYAHSDQLFSRTKYTAERFGRSVERYPELIVSRIRKDQISFYEMPKQRKNSVDALFGLPFVFFNRDQNVCGVGNYQVDLSYTGDFLKQKFSKINSAMLFATMYDDKSSRLPSKYFYPEMKQRKKPDVTLNADNFTKIENEKNFFVLFNTAEPLYNEEMSNIYNEYLTSALWEDANKDGSAIKEEISKLDIKKFSEMNTNRNFSFYFIPTINRTDFVPAPLTIMPAFTYGEEPDPSRAGTYFVGEDPEGSSISTAWNGILTDIIKGKTFGESALLGYTEYFKIIKDDEDEWAQGLNATRLNLFGLPWYTIEDLIAQPEIQIEKDYFQTSKSEMIIPIRNIGDSDLIITLDDTKKIIIQPEQIYELIVKNKTQVQYPHIGLDRLPKKYYQRIELQTNTRKHPKIQLIVEFWR
ncbi:MAG: hypothetical protein PHY32_00785 [Candidatus Pacebacteria bacterium]|nr:hypothetical protein [Candidatus Paceibacterota bacterium]